MAKAYKCDRCGRLYDGPDKCIFPKFCTGSDSYITTLLLSNPKGWNSGLRDLCPDCAQDFLVWWEHSNISAQYELQRIEDNLRVNAEFAAHNVVKTYIKENDT